MRVPVNHHAITDNTFFFDLRGEVFLPHDEGIIETYASTIRLGLNLGYRQNEKWRYQLTGYVDGGKAAIGIDRTRSRLIIEASVRTTF
jgi:hypothetical protein